MTIKKLIDIANKHSLLLDNKKPHTSYKIDYVTNYVGKWLLVMTNLPTVTTFNFIDCMCNAGIYQDGELGTSIRVLLLFKEYCKKYPNKQFNIFLNDNNNDRLKIINEVITGIISTPVINLNIDINTGDVNDYINGIERFKKSCLTVRLQLFVILTILVL